MTGKEYLESKGIEVKDDYLWECPSYYGLKDNKDACHPDGYGCEDCVREALESEKE